METAETERYPRRAANTAQSEILVLATIETKVAIHLRAADVAARPIALKPVNAVRNARYRRVLHGRFQWAGGGGVGGRLAE